MWASGSVRTLKSMARVRQASPAQRRHAAAMRRDGALSRLSSITAAIGVAIIAAVGALGVYVGKALPGPSRPVHVGHLGSRGEQRVCHGQQRSSHRQQWPGSAQPAVLTAAGGLTSRAGHQRIELMSQACDRRRDPQRVFRTRALGTMAELVVSDSSALVAASELLELELERIDRVASRFRR